MPLTIDQKIAALVGNLAAWSSGIRQIGMNVGIQMDGIQQNRYSRFYLELLKRQVIILDDIHLILSLNDSPRITSACALVRCLLDDFILLLHLASKEFEEEEINRFEAKQWETHFKTLRESAAMNHKYFDGARPGMYTNETYENRLNEFKARETSTVYFDAQNGWKHFDTTRDLIVNLPETELGQANAHAFILWKYFSSHVHFSPDVSKLDTDKEFRYLELVHLKEALSYCFKSLFIISAALRNKYGLDHNFADPQGIQNAIHQPLPD